MHFLPAAAAITAALLLAGCYVDTYIEIGPDDDPPSVSLAASPATAEGGETIGLVAAASDDYTVAEVEFYRLDAGGNTFLGRDTSAPYALDTVLPTGASVEVRYLAVAIDDAGQESESAAVAVTLR
ncbi:MAG: Ig-like domain-containing protein [Pseudomonadota bacterium]